MLALVCLIIGCVTGWLRASRRGGDTGDKLQYAVGHGIAFGLGGMALGFALAWSGLFS